LRKERKRFFIGGGGRRIENGRPVEKLHKGGEGGEKKRKLYNCLRKRRKIRDKVKNIRSHVSNQKKGLYNTTEEKRL